MNIVNINYSIVETKKRNYIIYRVKPSLITFPHNSYGRGFGDLEVEEQFEVLKEVVLLKKAHSFFTKEKAEECLSNCQEKVKLLNQKWTRSLK